MSRGHATLRGRLRRRDHLAHVVVFGEPAAKEHTAEVNIECHVAAGQVAQRNLEIALQDLDGHRTLLLRDAGEQLQASAQLGGGRLVAPETTGVTVVVVEDDARGLDDPTRDQVHEAMQLRGLLHRGRDSRAVGGDADWIEVPETLAQLVRKRPGALRLDPHVGHDRNEERERVVDHHLVRFGVRREVHTVGSELCGKPVRVLQQCGRDRMAVR
jgi:hypothetical protein